MLTKHAVGGPQEQPNGDTTHEERPTSSLDEGEASGPFSQSDLTEQFGQLGADTADRTERWPKSA